MTEPKYSEEYLAALRKNPRIQSCSVKTITYTAAFKEEALGRFEEGELASAIFADAGIDMTQHASRYCRYRIKSWRAVVRKRGITALRSSRQGRPSANTGSLHDRVKELELEVAYLKKKNHFLVGLRALRTE